MTRPSTAGISNRERRRLRRLIVEPRPKAEAGPRLPGLDALRSASMVAVVAAHAAYAYASCRVSGLPWAVRDGSRSFGFDLLTWSAISWAMPAFFALGGLAAAALWSSRGPRGFVRDRLRRIAIPAMVAIPTVLGPSLVVWCGGWLASGRVNFKQIAGMVFVDPELRANWLGPAHLWFLEYLILMLGGFVLIRLAGRRSPGPAPDWVFSRLGPFALALPTALILWLGHVRNGLDPIMDMRNSFMPNPLRWLHHAWFFAVGTRLYESRGELPRLIRHAPTFLGLALPVFAVRAYLLRADLDRDARRLAGLGHVGVGRPVRLADPVRLDRPVPPRLRRGHADRPIHGRRLVLDLPDALPGRGGSPRWPCTTRAGHPPRSSRSRSRRRWSSACSPIRFSPATPPSATGSTARG